ncbi:FecR family protein [Sphingobacterium tabacisoli]|uniref:FecR family protein n=1 Tax=Sphingobacterium tabacisoli TaxID=2044855 RepID=A0ABW5L7N4_9SPHI|nr:FecR family protein [Sphingobacterium tabacisoli]
MNSEKFNKIVQGYLNNELSQEHSDKVDSWYETVSSEEVTPFTNGQHRDHIQAQIQAGITAQQPIVLSLPRKRKIRWLSIVAGLLFAGIASGLFFYKNGGLPSFTSSTAMSQVMTDAGEIREFILPDSSSIFLSGNTKLRFDRESFKSERKVYLDQGEAFFNVQHDAQHPFSVATGGLHIQVLGTSFNVHNATSRHQVAVDVQTGRVSVTDKEQQSYVLTAGKSLRYDAQEGLFTCFDRNAEYANMWTQGGFILDGVTFEELSDRMLSRYGVTLKTENLDTHNFRYSLLMPQVETVEQLMTMICSIHQLKFRRDKNEITLYR